MILFYQGRRCLQSVRWLSRAQTRSLSRGQLYEELRALKQRSHIHALFPTKAEEEIEEVRRIRNEIWAELNGGTQYFTCLTVPSLLWTDC
jgi:hypothetical protein